MRFLKQINFEMKKPLFLLFFVAVFTMLSHNAFTQEVTINLQPGWNWIGYPKAEAMDISTALGSFSPMEGDVIKSQSKFTMYQDGEWSGNLTQFMPGGGYMYLSNRTYAVDIVIGGAVPQLLITLDAPYDITTTAATCIGDVNVEPGSNLSVILKGMCWGGNPNPTLNDNYMNLGDELGHFTMTMTELNNNSLYYVRAFAITSMGIFYSSQQSFTTLPIVSLPTVTTNTVSNVLATSATCGGNVTNDGYGTVTARGVCWSTSSNPTISNIHTTDGSGTGSFTSSITGLTPATKYYVRAYATNEEGTAYGSSRTFTTPVALPTVTTLTMYDIGPTAAFGGGNVTNAGGGTITEKGVCWSTSGTPTINNNKTTNGEGTGTFYSALMALTPGTTYYLRAYATNEAGTAYGAKKTFTTLATYESSVSIVAHRGFYKFADPSGNSIAIPESAENSLYAAQKAIDCDFDGVEFDVQITKDNQLIVFHNLTMNGNKIYNTNYATLQGLAEFTLSNGETVPKLTTFLNTCKNRLTAQEQRLGERHTKLVLEVKTHKSMGDTQINTLVTQIVQYVQQYGVEDDIFFISFNMNVCQLLHAQMPDAPVAYLSSRSTDNSGTSPAYTPQVLLNTYGIPHIDYEYQLLQSDYHPEWLQQAHNLGMTVNVWTVDKKALTIEMRNLGVDFITTNHPMNMRSWLEQ